MQLPHGTACATTPPVATVTPVGDKRALLVPCMLPTAFRRCWQFVQVWESTASLGLQQVKPSACSSGNSQQHTHVVDRRVGEQQTTKMTHTLHRYSRGNLAEEGPCLL
jgi:hypothetical protein